MVRMNNQNTYHFPGVNLPDPKYHFSKSRQSMAQILRSFTLKQLLNVLNQNRWQIDPEHRLKALNLIATAPLFSMLKARENFLYSKQLDSMELNRPPVFVLGHWRSGTTFLHNLLSQDRQFTSLKTYQAFFADSFLLPKIQSLSGKISNQWAQMKTRPMDNIKFGSAEPIEEEFAMAVITGMSPYIRILFPRTLGRDCGFVYPNEPEEKNKEVWKAEFERFLKRMTFFENKKPLLKSPPHTARIHLLLEMFPDARFIHIVRHPYDMYASNLLLWRDAISINFLQSVSSEDIIEIVLSTYEQLYRCYHKEKEKIPKGQLVEIKYEDFEKNPMGELARIYDQLGLSGFVKMEPFAQSYLDSLGKYKKNNFTISEDVKTTIYRRWRETFDIYDYMP